LIDNHITAKESRMAKSVDGCTSVPGNSRAVCEDATECG